LHSNNLLPLALHVYNEQTSLQGTEAAKALWTQETYYKSTFKEEKTASEDYETKTATTVGEMA
jgi:hypothetical protein